MKTYKPNEPKITDKTVAEQLRPFQFKKGKSGNPKGRPKGTRNFITDFEEVIKFIVKRARK